jgi:hypothetical protein
MRTTVTLADDVAAAAEQLRLERGAGISDAINELVRRGLSARPRTPRFRQETSDLGPARISLDDIGGVLDALEGDDRRS